MSLLLATHSGKKPQGTECPSFTAHSSLHSSIATKHLMV